MTPKEKAKALVMSFLNAPNRIKGKEDLGLMLFIVAKQCALINVEGIVKVLDEISIQESGTTLMDYGQSEWKGIKEEINKL